jgi:hypothetical protein
VPRRLTRMVVRRYNQRRSTRVTARMTGTGG